MTMSDHTGFLLARYDEDERDLALARYDGDEWYIPDAARRDRLTVDLEAKRRIVELHGESEFCERIVMFEVLCLLALPYADHPDYREEWRP